MRNKNPIARVVTAKMVMIATECTKDLEFGRILMDMLIKFKKDGTSLLEIAKTCGCAPCQILFVNGVKNETELNEKAEILVPICIEHMCHLLK